MGFFCIYFPTILITPQSSAEIEGGQHPQGHRDSPVVERCYLVPKASKYADRKTSTFRQQPIPASSPSQKKDSSFIPFPETDGLSLIREKYKKQGIKPSLTELLLKGWRRSTLQQYNVYLKKWIQFCNERKVKPLRRDKLLVLKFLQKLFKSNLSYSSLNTCRSALSAVFDKPPIGDTPLISRFMRSVYNQRPNLPKYHDTWQVSTVLEYLRSLSPVKFLSLKQLSLKLATLLALVTGSRVQTLHAMDLNFCEYKDDSIVFYIQSLLKHSRPSNKVSNGITISAYKKDKRICPVFLLKYYIKRTASLRKNNQLFINNNKPHKPISKDTLSRWIKMGIKKSGINTAKYSSHSTRSASTSAAAAASVDITTIMKAAKWSNSCTFTKHYKKPIADNSFSTAILQSLQ